MPTAICPECTEEVYIDADSEQGDRVDCADCGSSLEVVGLDPFEVDKVVDEDSDRFDDDDMESYDYDS